MMLPSLYKRCKCADEGACAHPWWFKFQHLGTIYRESTRLTVKKEAMRLAVQRRTALIKLAGGCEPDDDGGGGGRKRGAAILLDTLAARYLEFAIEDHPLSGAEDDPRIVKQFVDIIGATKPIHTISPITIGKWRTDRGKMVTRRGTRVTRGTINREMNTIRSMFRKAHEWYGMLSPFAKKPGQKKATIADLSTDERKVQILTAEQQRIALKGLPDPYNLFCEITLNVLARLSEVLTLTREDVGIVLHGSQRIGWLDRRLKGGKRRRVRIPLDLAERLIARLTTPAQHWIFPEFDVARLATGPRAKSRKVRKPRPCYLVSAQFTRLFRALGLRCSHHAFRHTGVTRMMEQNVNQQTIQDLAGWSSLKQLKRYGHVTDLSVANAVEIGAEYIRMLKGDGPLPTSARADETAALAALDESPAVAAL